MIADYYLLAGSFLPRIGLLDGKTGLALFFFRYYHHTGIPVYQEYAGQLIDEIYEVIGNHTPINLGHGLLGFGWALAYLHHHGFVEGCIDDILEEIDAQAAQMPEMNDYSLARGEEGLLFYLLCRQYGSGHTIFHEEVISRVEAQVPNTYLPELLVSDKSFRFETAFNLLLNQWEQKTLFNLSWKTIFNAISI